MALLACSGGPPSASQASTTAVTFRDLLKIQRPIDIQLSPSGSQVAFVVRTADFVADALRTSLWVVDTAGGTPRRLSSGDSDVGAVRWSRDGTRLAFVATDDTGSRIEVLDASGAALQTIPGAAPIGEISWSPDGSRIAFTSPSTNPELPQLWTVDLASGQSSVLVEGNAATLDPQWSPDGSGIAYVRIAADIPDGRFFPTIEIVDVTTKQTRILAGPAEFVSSPRWSPDGTRLAYLAHPGQTEQERALAFDRIEVIPIAGGTPQVIAPSFTFVQRRPAWSSDGQTLFFEAFTGETGQLFSVPSSGGDAVAFSEVNGVAYLANYASNGSSMAFLQEDPQAPPEISVSPAPPRFKPKQITDLNRRLREIPTGESRAVRWKSTDGLEISGVLLLPPGFREGTPVPTLVVSHGGPATLVVLSYNDSWLLSGAPAWTTEGWAVFYPNYRGSTNRDQALAFAEIGQVGRGDFDDVMTGVDSLIAQGIADPNRLAHSGWSFGGFLSGWANAHTSRFKAIVAGAGPYDWTTTYPDSADQFVLRTYLQGTPASNPQEYRRASVSTWVNSAHTPTLLFGAEADDLVPATQPQAFFDALQSLKVPSELRIFSDEPHELLRPSDQLEKLEHERAWIRRYTP
jgi:dipeptidyl aminopeptidase/acylaminoacyl peptidase